MSRREQIEKEIAALQRELESLNHRPAEPDDEPAVIFFEKTFGKSQKYTYTAVRAGERWWITGTRPGRNPNPKTWEQLLDFAEQGEKHPVEIWRAAQLERLGDS